MSDQETVTLSADDPFDRALIPLVLTNRRKRADYAQDSDPFSNFRDTSSSLGLDGFGPAESALFNVLQKVARLKSLRTNGRMSDTKNEAVQDTYLDLACYSIILYAIILEQSEDSVREDRRAMGVDRDFCGERKPGMSSYWCSAKVDHPSNMHVWTNSTNGVVVS